MPRHILIKNVNFEMSVIPSIKIVLADFDFLNFEN